tara:strand:- start:3531 stop:4199 length:669 start_codon:yes stop_codon:yes gene_type:complete
MEASYLKNHQGGGIALLIGLLVTFSALGKWGVSAKFTSDKPSRITPRNAAFGIWTPIFALVFFKALNSILNKNAEENFVSLILLSTSFIFSALWVYFANIPNFSNAAFSITTAALLAFTSYYLEEKPSTTTTWISQSAGAMTASWLLLASAISWDYAIPRINFPPILPLVLITIISTISIYSEKPLYMISLLWASLFLKEYNVLAISISSFLTFLSVYNYIL